MSLLKRLWVSVVVAMGLVLVGAFAVSLMTARGYFEQQLRAQSSDGAVSLALSMSQQTKDAATMELLVTALFDGGHYRSIRFIDSSGKVKIERSQPDQPEDVPGWLVTVLPMDVRPGQAQVSDGWRQIGLVSVEAARGYAYRSLWNGVLQLGSLMLAIGLFWAMGVSALLRWCGSRWRRWPSRRRRSAPGSSGAGRAKVVELRSVAAALNHMSGGCGHCLPSRRRGSRRCATRAAAIRAPGCSTGRASAASCAGCWPIPMRRPWGAWACCGSPIWQRSTSIWAGPHRRMADGGGQGDAGQPGRRGRRVAGLVGGADFAILLPGQGLDEAGRFSSGSRAQSPPLDLQTSDAGGLKARAAVMGYRRGEAAGTVLARVDSALMRAESIDALVVNGEGVDIPTPAPGEGAWRG